MMAMRPRPLHHNKVGKAQLGCWLKKSRATDLLYSSLNLIPEQNHYSYCYLYYQHRVMSEASRRRQQG